MKKCNGVETLDSLNPGFEPGTENGMFPKIYIHYIHSARENSGSILPSVS